MVWPFAAPSWSLPGDVAFNARFLAGRVAEVGLCFFESSSAFMPEEELPRELAALPLRWHVHLPVDADQEDGAHAARACAGAWERAAFLRPWAAVLHLPEREGPWLGDFMAAWTSAGHDPAALLLENTQGSAPWARADVPPDAPLCLDVAHVMAFDQHSLLDEPGRLSRVRLAHWSAPGAADRHLPLTAWTPDEAAFAARVAALLPRGTTHLIEVFDWEGIVQSWPVLRALTGAAEA